MRGYKALGDVVFDGGSQTALALVRVAQILARQKAAFEARRMIHPASRHIVGSIKATAEFNAAAWADGKDFYVGLSASVIPLLTLFFRALLSDKKVLPRLPFSKKPSSDIGKFVFDVREPAVLKGFEPYLTPEREAAADVLCDLCVSFVYLHEIGHVVCGHPPASLHLMGERALAEFVRPRPGSGRYREMRHYWEFQADSIAAVLIPQYLDLLYGQAAERAWIDQLVPKNQRCEPTIRAHLSALTAAALNAMFAYMEGGRLEMGYQATHPHPVVRALYVKDLLIAASARRWSIKPKVIADLVFSYFEPFMFRLADLGLGAIQDWDPDVLDEMIAEAQTLPRRHQYRRAAAKWSWLSDQELGSEQS